VPSASQQIELAVLELSSIAGSFYRLSLEAGNQRLALSCELTYRAVADALDANFPGWNR
jgi:hypothetical protein